MRYWTVVKYLTNLTTMRYWILLSNFGLHYQISYQFYNYEILDSSKISYQIYNYEIVDSLFANAMNIHHHRWCKFRLKICVSKGPSPTKVRDPFNSKQFLEETKNHLEREGDVAGLVDPVDVVVVEAGNSLPFFIFVQHILREFSTPVHDIWKM